MIYVYDAKLKHYRISKKSRRRVFFACFLFLIIILATFFVRYNVNPIIFSLSEANARSMAASSISQGVSDTLKTNISYNDLITVSKDEHGKINMLQANTVRINILARDAVRRAQNYIDINGQKGIDVPIGSITGIPVFVGKGSKIKVRVSPIGTIVCTFRSEFNSAGINQTLHKIYIRFEGAISVILPGEQRTLDIFQEALVSESLLIGEIPSVYLQSGSLDETLNLIPETFTALP